METQKRFDLAFRTLSRKNDAKVLKDKEGNVYVGILSGDAYGRRNDLGNGSWGHIDFLRGQGMRVEYMDKFPRR